MGIPNSPQPHKSPVPKASSPKNLQKNAKIGKVLEMSRKMRHSGRKIPLGEPLAPDSPSGYGAVAKDVSLTYR